MTLDARLPLRLAEGTAVEVRIAGVASRAVAAGIDLVIATFVIIALSPGVRSVVSPSEWWLASAPAVAALGAVAGFPMLCELATGGRTPGKTLTGLRVVPADGGLLTRRALAVRNALRVVDALPFPYGIGLVTALRSERGQRVGDTAAGTAVVRVWVLDRAALAPPTSTVLDWAVSTSVVGLDPRIWDTGGLDADDLRAVRRFLDRRATLPPSVRGWAAEELVRRIGPKMMGVPGGIPAEAVLEGAVLGRVRSNDARR